MYLKINKIVDILLNITLNEKLILFDILARIKVSVSQIVMSAFWMNLVARYTIILVVIIIIVSMNLHEHIVVLVPHDS